MTTAIVIDNDKNIVMLLSDLLKISGVKVVGQGYNGSDAVELYKKLKPDVAFIDIMMLGMDGFYALKKIRAYDPNAKVVAVTADLDSETVERLEALKISAIVYKPFDVKEIKQVLMTKLKIKINDS